MKSNNRKCLLSYTESTTTKSKEAQLETGLKCSYLCRMPLKSFDNLGEVVQLQNKEILKMFNSLTNRRIQFAFFEHLKE